MKLCKFEGKEILIPDACTMWSVLFDVSRVFPPMTFSGTSIAFIPIKWKPLVCHFPIHTDIEYMNKELCESSCYSVRATFKYAKLDFIVVLKIRKIVHSSWLSWNFLFWLFLILTLILFIWIEVLPVCFFFFFSSLFFPLSLQSSMVLNTNQIMHWNRGKSGWEKEVYKACPDHLTEPNFTSH